MNTERLFELIQEIPSRVKEDYVNSFAQSRICNLLVSTFFLPQNSTAQCAGMIRMLLCANALDDFALACSEVAEFLKECRVAIDEVPKFNRLSILDMKPKILRQLNERDSKIIFLTSKDLDRPRIGEEYWQIVSTHVSYKISWKDVDDEIFSIKNIATRYDDFWLVLDSADDAEQLNIVARASQIFKRVGVLLPGADESWGSQQVERILEDVLLQGGSTRTLFSETKIGSVHSLLDIFSKQKASDWGSFVIDNDEHAEYPESNLTFYWMSFGK